MNSIKERFQSLRENYTVANAINYVDFLDTCSKSDIVECFESTFVEPIKGTEFSKKFILINSFTENELNMMKASMESFIQNAENTLYENESHLEEVRGCIEIINAKLECVEHTNLVDLVLESFYLDDMEITCESKDVSDKTIKQIISKDVDDETKIKLANKLVDRLKRDSIPLDTVNAINTIVGTTSIVIYYALSVPVLVITSLLPLPIVIVSKIINEGTKAGNISIYKKVIDSEIKKVEAAQKSGKDSSETETYRQNLIKARTMLNDVKRATVESTLISLDDMESTHEKVKTLDTAIRENFVKFALSEDETIEESVSWFKNVVALSNARDLIVEELTSPVCESFKDRYKSALNLQKNVGNAEEFKRIAKDAIDNVKTEKELRHVMNIIKSNSLGAAHPVLIGSGSIRGTVSAIKNREDSKEIGEWVKSAEYKSLITKKMKEVSSTKKSEKINKESSDLDIFDELEDEFFDIDDEFFDDDACFDDDELIGEGVISNLFKDNRIQYSDFDSTYRKDLLEIAKACKDKAIVMSKMSAYKKIEDVDYVAKEHRVDKDSIDSGRFDVYTLYDRYTSIAINVMSGQDAIVTKCGQDVLKEIDRFLNNTFKNKLKDKDGNEVIKIDTGDGDEGCIYIDYVGGNLGFSTKDTKYKVFEGTDEYIVQEGSKSDEIRKKVNVTSNKIKSKAHKLKDNAKKAGQGAKAAAHQVGKAGKALDDAATNTVNKAKGVYRNDIREEIIEDKTRIKLFRIIRKGIGLGVATMINPVLGAITGLTTYALSKKVKEKERRRILQELNEELEIVNEKIEDARGDSNKEKKYNLMRIRNQLQKDITRIQYRIKSDGKGV